MRKHTVTTAATLCAAATLVAALGTASAAPAASPPAVQQRSGNPVIVDCLWHPKVRPTDFMIACGDGNSFLSSIHWSQWGSASAVAKAVNVVNDCKPYCAAGRFHPYPVIVRLDHPQTWKTQPQLRHYTRMSLTYTDGRPDGFGRMVTYPLWN